MNYSIHYCKLIERARHRILEGYTEKHRIIPGCLGGTYEKNNVVLLMPEEHYVAHQLLIKIYPNQPKLIHAAMMMTVKSKNHQRSKNRTYGWLKRKYISECRKRIGKKNPSYGRRWYYNSETLESGKFLTEDIPAGWKRGRVPPNRCVVCDNRISQYATRCQQHAPAETRKDENPYRGREQEFYMLYDKHGSMNKACRAMGFPGAMSHWYKGAKRLLDKRT